MDSPESPAFGLPGKGQPDPDLAERGDPSPLCGDPGGEPEAMLPGGDPPDFSDPASLRGDPGAEPSQYEPFKVLSSWYYIQ